MTQCQPANSRVLVAVMLVISGCSSIDRNLMSGFEPFTDDDGGVIFSYWADEATLTYPEDSPDAEAIRMQWLERYLELNELCLDGYEIVERKAVAKTRGIGGIAHRIVYKGHCI